MEILKFPNSNHHKGISFLLLHFRKIEKENSKSSLEIKKRELKSNRDQKERNPITEGEFIGGKQFIRRTENAISKNYQNFVNKKVNLPCEKEVKVSAYVKEGKIKNSGSDVKNLLDYVAPNE